MNILSHFRQHPRLNRSTTVRVNELDTTTLPVVFIPYFIVEKLKAYNLDYKEVFGKLHYNLEFEWESTDTKVNAINEFNKTVGLKESTLLSILNRRMLQDSMTQSYQSCIQSFINFELTDADYSKGLIDLTNQLSILSDSDEYSIENNNNCFFIILNSNSFAMYEDTYKKMSKDLCKRLLAFIDESFIYQSCFFKSL